MKLEYLLLTAILLIAGCTLEHEHDNLVQPVEPNRYSIPLRPSNLEVEFLDDNNVHISWQDNSDNEDGFRLEESYSVPNWVEYSYTLPENYSSFFYSDWVPNGSNRPPPIQYRATLTAFNRGGESPSITYSYNADEN